MVARAFFICSAAIVVYVYACHPIFLRLLAQVRPRSWSKGSAKLSVAVFVSAFNEEKVIERKVRNLLKQDYDGPLTIVIANDGSSDHTADIVRSFCEPRIQLYDFRSNRGKAAMQNAIVPALPHEVIIFSDATSDWPENTVTKILESFFDAEVGCVAVDLCFVSEKDGVIEKGQGAYWRYERFLRVYGALVWTNIVASGTTYAIRKALFRPIRADIGEDLSNPLHVAVRGKRVIFDPSVVIEERSTSSHASELRMRTRIAVRNVAGLAEYIKFLHPSYGFAAYQLLVHKYLRVLCWLPMAVALISSYMLRNISPYGYLLLAQLVCYFLALVGYISVQRGRRSRFTYLFYYFVLLNYACMVGVFSYVWGVRRPTWTPQR